MRKQMEIRKHPDKPLKSYAGRSCARTGVRCNTKQTLIVKTDGHTCAITLKSGHNLLVGLEKRSAISC